MAGRSPASRRRRRAGEAELVAWSARRFSTTLPLEVLTASRPRRAANLTAVRAYVTRFEVAHGVTSANWADAFVGDGGMPVEITETDDYTILSGLYALLAGIADSPAEARHDLHRR